MNREEIISRHIKSHDAFIQYVNAISQADYHYSHNDEKWNVGEQLDHLNRTVGVLAKALKAPKFLLRYKFGKSNRPSKTMEALVKKYTDGIKAGFKANGKFVPDMVPFKNKDKRISILEKNTRSIEKNIGRYSEKNLDAMIIPHPALGILTMREMMYFTIHHIEDHLSQIKRNLSWRES